MGKLFISLIVYIPLLSNLSNLLYQSHDIQIVEEESSSEEEDEEP